jgi:hypothetical protein
LLRKNALAYSQVGRDKDLKLVHLEELFSHIILAIGIFKAEMLKTILQA